MSDLTKLVEDARKSMVADGLLGVFEGRTPDQANDDAVNILTALADQAHAQGKVEGAIEELEYWAKWANDAALDGISPITLESRAAELREEQSK